MASSISKVGIYFGSFDPVHINHVQLCLNLLENDFKYVYMIPNQANHMKPYIVSMEHRLAMINEVIDELKLDGRLIAYRSNIEQHTWPGRDKIADEIVKLHPKETVEIHQIIGQDSFEKAVIRCKEHDGIYAIKGRLLLVYPRLGYTGEIKVPISLKDIAQIIDYKDSMVCSSTDIREGLKKLPTHLDAKKAISCIYSSVYKYICSNGLYRVVASKGKIIAIFGPPGSGKGSLCTSLCRIYPKYIHISTGDLYRDDESKKTQEYLKIAEAKKKGMSYYNDALNEYIVTKLKTLIDPKKCYFLDGLKPTDLFSFEQNVAPVDGIAVLNCRYGVAFGRLKKRQQNSQRLDDADDKIRHRLNNYFKYLFIQQEILKSYQSTGRSVYNIQGENPIAQSIRSYIWKNLLLK